ncbi:MAG: phosphoserine phosphatase SerB [Marinibacterium sp.]
MYVASLIVAPHGAPLDPQLVLALENAWGGGTPRWLSPVHAAEFDLPKPPDNQWEVWAELQAQQVDLVIQPAENRRKKILLADMDSTMIQQECVDELAEVAGVGDKVRAITTRAMNGELDFNSSLTERVALLKGLDTDVIARVLSDRITLTPGGRALVATMRRQGARAALVSGGFSAFTNAVAGWLGFDEHRANTLMAENGTLTGEVARPILGRDAKVRALDEITAHSGLRAEDVLAVGDGANDLGMLARAGMGVALHAKPSVAQQCDIRINHGDLTALLYLQGYRDQEITDR